MKLSVKCDSCGMQDCHQKGVTDDRKCDSPKRGVKGIREVSQVERDDGYEGGVRRCGKV